MVMNATVKIYGATKDKNNFTGSAVILNVGKAVDFIDGKWKINKDKRFTVLVSALHNLKVYNGLFPLTSQKDAITWDQDYATSFASGVRIYYGDGKSNMDWGKKPSGVAAIHHVVPVFKSNVGAAGKMVSIKKDASFDEQEFQLVNLAGETNPDGKKSPTSDKGITPSRPGDSWGHDVVLLLSSDPGLHSYATEGGKCNFMANVSFKHLSESWVNNWGRGLDQRTPVMVGRTLLQLGYGQTSDGSVEVRNGTTKRPVAPSGAVMDALQYKRSTALNTATAKSFFLQSDQKLSSGRFLVLEHEGGLFLSCSRGNNSTFRGDSGGPLVAFLDEKRAKKPELLPGFYLVGVSYGAGLAMSEAAARAKKGEDGWLWDYANNVATSLGFFYEKLYDLRFQNV